MFMLKISAALAFVALLGSLAVAQQTGSIRPSRKQARRRRRNPWSADTPSRPARRKARKEPEERIKGTIVTFTKDTVIVTDKDKKEIVFRQL